MTRINWDDSAKNYEYGVDRAVLYFRPGISVPWNGIIRVEDNAEPVGMEPIFFDGQLVNIQRKPQTFKARITAYVYPEMLEDLIVANGDPELVDAERNQPVHMTYRVKTQNGHQIHMLYNCVFTPQTVTSNTIGSDIDIAPFVFDVTCLPVSYGVNIYPHSGNRYDSPNYELTPPPAGSDPTAWQDYLKNKYIEDQPPTLPPFIYPDPTDFDYPHFNDHLDLDTMFPTPHFIFDDSLLDPDKWLSLEDMLYGNVDLTPVFGSPQEVFDLMLGPNPALGVDFGDGANWDVGGVEFGLATSSTTLGGTLASSYNFSTCLIPLEHGTALLHCQEQTDTAGVAAARLQMVSYDGSGNIVTGDPLTLSMYWDLGGSPYEQWSKKPSYIGNGRVVMPMQTQLENGQPAGHLFTVNYNNLSITHNGAIGVDINVGNNPWQVATDGVGNAILFNANDGNHWWINSDGTIDGMFNAGSGTNLRNMMSEHYEQPSVNTKEPNTVTCIRAFSNTQLARYSVDFSAKTVSSPTFISPSGMNDIYGVSWIRPGLSVGKVSASIKTSAPSFSQSVAEEWYNKEIADLASSSDYADGISRAMPGSVDIFSWGGVATGLRGIVTLYQVYNGSVEYSEMSYYNPASTYREVVPIVNTGDRRYMDLADVGNGYFIYLSASEADDANVILRAGWAR